MSAISLNLPTLVERGSTLSEQDGVRRAAAYGLAGLIHIAFFLALIALSPGVVQTAGRALSAIDVRLYTVAGGEAAESDAPLFEPPLSVDLEGGQVAGEGAGDTTDLEGVSAGTNQPTEVEVPAPIELAEPVELPQAELPAPVVEDATPSNEDSQPDAILLSDNGLETQGEPIPQTAARPPTVVPPPQSAAAAGAPLATTQVAVPERNAQPAPRVSFADILERTRQDLNPDDYRFIQLLGGVSGTIRGSFCLSSASGNREAMDCPDTPNPESVELARYGLMGLGEEMPVFLEDMDRLAFELQQLGANASAVQRIMTAVGAARREAIATDPLLRSMQRDGAARVDNLGSSLDSVMPANARDPSGG